MTLVSHWKSLKDRGLKHWICNVWLSPSPQITVDLEHSDILYEVLGCALFSKFLGLNAVLVELDELSSGVPSFLKSDHGKLLRIAILCLVTWVSRGTCVMVS